MITYGVFVLALDNADFFLGAISMDGLTEFEQRSGIENWWKLKK